MSNWYDKANKYRQNFNELEYGKHIEIYEDVLKEYPDQASYNLQGFINLYNVIPLKEKRIFELGGWMGHLANDMLLIFDDIKLWHNYDIVSLLKDKQMSNDKRYKFIVEDDFVWNMDIKPIYNIFVATHTIEHFSKEFIEILVKFINKMKFEYLILEAPLHPSKTRNWANNPNLHVLTLAWDTLLFMFGGYDVLNKTEVLYKNKGDTSYTFILRRKEK